MDRELGGRAGLVIDGQSHDLEVGARKLIEALGKQAEREWLLKEEAKCQSLVEEGLAIIASGGEVNGPDERAGGAGASEAGSGAADSAEALAVGGKLLTRDSSILNAYKRMLIHKLADRFRLRRVTFKGAGGGGRAARGSDPAPTAIIRLVFSPHESRLPPETLEELEASVGYVAPVAPRRRRSDADDSEAVMGRSSSRGGAEGRSGSVSSGAGRSDAREDGSRRGDGHAAWDGSDDGGGSAGRRGRRRRRTRRAQRGGPEAEAPRGHAFAPSHHYGQGISYAHARAPPQSRHLGGFHQRPAAQAMPPPAGYRGGHPPPPPPPMMAPMAPSATASAEIAAAYYQGVTAGRRFISQSQPVPAGDWAAQYAHPGAAQPRYQPHGGGSYHHFGPGPPADAMSHQPPPVHRPAAAPHAAQPYPPMPAYPGHFPDRDAPRDAMLLDPSLRPPPHFPPADADPGQEPPAAHTASMRAARPARDHLPRGAEEDWDLTQARLADAAAKRATAELEADDPAPKLQPPRRRSPTSAAGHAAYRSGGGLQPVGERSAALRMTYSAPDVWHRSQPGPSEHSRSFGAMVGADVRPAVGRPAHRHTPRDPEAGAGSDAASGNAVAMTVSSESSLHED
ncbi:hypothetical protein FNF29_05207 [Cafeteria roenbergensis]|uniref:R3H domain-containing protein n=1 Tax=Cafeteria roenbergensis TaxID=33653 RepID=A0A5A8CCC8_CAFRO|nr:hypothetical protein FNF29_05207 [Cafeteria roenbergensis]|eukprot:KAA0150632.1 hypothetical protein FNF29_05207 [Cafeteria roenbergensis]